MFVMGFLRGSGGVGVDAESAQFPEFARGLRSGGRVAVGSGDGVAVQAVFNGDGAVDFGVGEAVTIDIPGALEGAGTNRHDAANTPTPTTP